MSDDSEALPVLVVDDERDIRDGCERILAHKGCAVTKACDGLEALEHARARAFSIVLLDLKMPGMDGLEVLRRILKIHPDTLIIVITGYATIETAIEAMKRGAYDFIPKPFRPDQLRIVIDRAMERMRLREQAERLEQERRRTLHDLDMEKSRTRTILQALPDGVLVSTPDAHVALMNPACQRMLGIASDARTGQHIDRYVAEETLREVIGRASRGEVPGEQPSATYDFSPEEGRYLRAHTTPVIGETNECLGAVTVLMDISGLMMLDKLKSQFVAQVSHELRSPLSTIHEQLAMVLSDLVGEVDPEQRHVLSRAKEKTHGLITLIGDLLDLSRIESGLLVREIKPVDLGRVLEGVVEFLRSKAAAKQQAIGLRLPEAPLPVVLAEAQAIEIIFGNLVTNAINYSPEGARIEVEGAFDDASVRVSVSDNGFGIEERHQEKIFERFYRVKDDQTRLITGTGLGLPIVKGIVDELGGHIELESRPGEGSTFTVHLPRVP